jgi:hypothetical protein
MGEGPRLDAEVGKAGAALFWSVLRIFRFTKLAPRLDTSAIIYP